QRAQLPQARPPRCRVIAWHMLRFSLLLRLVVSIAFLLAVVPFVAQAFLALLQRAGADNPSHADIASQLASLGGSSWMTATLLFVAGLTAGVWADWLLRKLDFARRATRKGLGVRLTSLAEEIARLEAVASAKSSGWPNNLGRARRAVTVALV